MTWTQLLAVIAATIAMVAAALAAPTTPEIMGDDTVSFLGKPSRTSVLVAADSTGLSLHEIRQYEADRLAASGYTGQGIDVAVIDTGVAPVQGLDSAGKVIHGPDLSNEGAVQNLATLDTYGHGTHMAAIIAGNDGTSKGFKGIAPDARIVSLKVAGATGQTHIAQVIAAIDWVVEHRNTDGLNIRVLNLSLGRDGVATSLNDPLSAAVERAWDAGIVVVVAAGNRSNKSDGLDSPAVSPYVIATGALDGKDAHDGVAKWSSGGNGDRNPDLVAAGASILSLRVPGSTLDQAYPEAVVGTRYMKGSGTSQAAAVTSGSAALLLSAKPGLTPDQVKAALTESSEDVDRRTTLLDGSGKVRPSTAVSVSTNSSVKQAHQSFPRAMRRGSWDDYTAWKGGTWSGGTWSGGTWSGATWSGATWSGATWSGATWSGGTWSGATWSGATWSGATWSGGTWSGATWSGGTWSGVRWSGYTSAAGTVVADTTKTLTHAG
ncbi:MAG: S8 family serine peptidase [Acidimicrobiales bacterium]|nr:S8 family serine peptidase [Acidimicrobiales bacterium]